MAVDDLFAHRLKHTTCGGEPGGRMARTVQEFVGPGQGHVAGQDRAADTPPCRVEAEPAGVAGGESVVDGGLSTTSRGAVHDVVVDETEGVEHLQCRSRPHDGSEVALAAARVPADHTQHGAQPFPARVQKSLQGAGEIGGHARFLCDSGLGVEELAQHPVDVSGYGGQVDGRGGQGQGRHEPSPPGAEGVSSVRLRASSIRASTTRCSGTVRTTSP